MPVRLPNDPRLFQLTFLATFLVAGALALGLDFPWWQPFVLLGTALCVQVVLAKRAGLPDLGLRSAAISALGLSLLLRTDLPWLVPLAAVLAIGSKFVLRFGGKHLFNPTNFGLALGMVATPHVWCSPSQWGESALVLAWFAVFGLTVVVRAFRSDVSLAFIGTWILLKLARVLYLGQRPEVLLHQLTVGSLILFTFFMISDPKTTPDHRLARIGFGAGVAGLAFFLQHQLWWQNTPVWALFFLSPLVPLLDHLLRGPRYQWPQQRSAPCLTDAPSPALSP